MAAATLLSAACAPAEDGGWYAAANVGLSKLALATLAYGDGAASETADASVCALERQ